MNQSGAVKSEALHLRQRGVRPFTARRYLAKGDSLPFGLGRVEQRISAGQRRTIPSAVPL